MFASLALLVAASTLCATYDSNLPDKAQIIEIMNNTERRNIVPDKGEEETASVPLFLARKAIQFIPNEFPIININQTWQEFIQMLMNFYNRSSDSLIGLKNANLFQRNQFLQLLLTQQTIFNNQYVKHISSIFNLIFIINLIKIISTYIVNHHFINFKQVSNALKNFNKSLIIIILAIFSAFQSFFIVESIPITYQYQDLRDTTTPIFLISDQNGDELMVSHCTFINCSNTYSQGGAIYSSISNGVIVSIDETQFIDCQCDQEGGAIFMQVASGSKIHFESCSMKGCYSAKNGGGLFMLILSSNINTAVYLSNLYILSCSSEWNGGGIYIDAQVNSTLSLINQFMFDNCKSVGDNFNGGGIYIEMTNPLQGIQMQGNYTFRNCKSDSQGGGMYMTTYQQKPISINCTFLFQYCISRYGGGMLISNSGNGDLTQLGGNFTFENCSAQLFGGGLFIESASNDIIEIDDFIFIECLSDHGGGILLNLVDNSKQIINGGKFINCEASIYGGGISVQLYSNSELVLNNSCYFYKCVCQECGGAIYAYINYSLPFQFKIRDTAIYGCFAEQNSSQTQYHSGFGGGIFLTGTGDYDPSTESLDFRGMNINLNYADNGGQSLYVVMPNLIQWCKSGVAGEYIKGNYSDKYSNFEEIEGISTDQITFNSLSLDSVQQQQAPLQYYWVYISILTKAQATLNISNVNQPLLINLEGYNMFAKYFYVKIVELEEISQMNKQNQIQTSINNNQNRQSQIQIQNQSSNSILAIINANSKNYNKHKHISNYDFEFVYPPDDGSSEFIHIEGDPQRLQTASFKINQFEWFNYDNKNYGVFVSNDGRIFTGINGRQDQAYPLEIILVKLEISILTKAQATLNVSNVNQPLLINLEGYNMIPSQFTVKIVELEEISLMNKLNQRHGSNNNQNKQSNSNNLNKSINPILTIAYSNSNNNNKINHISNYYFEIIYPPDDGSSMPINIEGDPQSLQTASFEMKDISWFDFDNKHYGVFVSNDGRIFTGIEGKQDQAYPLKVIIEKDDTEQEQDDIKQEQEIKNRHLSWWVILIIVLSSIILIILIIILICCIFFCWRKQKQEKNIEINYYTDMNYQNSRNLTEMNNIIENPANNHGPQNNQQQLIYYNKEFDQITRKQQYQQQSSLSSPMIISPGQQQSENFQIMTSTHYNSEQQQNDKLNQIAQQTRSHLYLTQRFSELYGSIQSQIEQTSSLYSIKHYSNNNQIDFDPSQNTNATVPVNNTILPQTENYQTNQSLANSSSGNSTLHSSNTSSSNTFSTKSLVHFLNISPFLFPESNLQLIDPSLRWQQQIQISSSEKDIDPPLKKYPPIYPEIQQSHNINDEEQQIIIDWDNINETSIPPFMYLNDLK